VPADSIADQLANATGPSRFGLWFAVTAVPILSFAVSCVASGALVGRFGNRAGIKEAVQGCTVAATVGALLSMAQAGWASSLASLVLLVPAGAASGWFGGRLGWRKRPLAERRSG
jgi:tRNA-(ms[2]io[6]A)-hydroxylase